MKAFFMCIFRVKKCCLNVQWDPNNPKYILNGVLKRCLHNYINMFMNCAHLSQKQNERSRAVGHSWFLTNFILTVTIWGMTSVHISGKIAFLNSYFA